jgi:hypothetical protein
MKTDDGITAVRVNLDHVKDGDMLGVVLAWMQIAGYVVHIVANDFRDERYGRTSYATPVHRQLFSIICQSKGAAENLAKHIHSFHGATAYVGPKPIFEKE